MNKPTSCVIYLRMSSEKQELSLDQQRDEVKKLAEREGYAIVGEYADVGKSGSKDTKKRMIWAMFCEANNRYATSISENTIRGRKDIASRGLWASGKIPFGYDRQYVDLSGVPKQLVKRTERFSKPRGWHLTLKVNKEEADVVRTMFHRFAHEDISLRELAAQLNKSGALSGGEVWTARLLKLALTNPAYVGKSYFTVDSLKSVFRRFSSSATLS